MHLSHCAALVREHDHDRYLCTLFAPPMIREAWFALFAFNHEIASIAESVSEEMLGFMRFAWWREVLDEVYGGQPVRRHPVAQALAEVVATHHLSRPLFDAMLDAREASLGRDIADQPARWEAYFYATSSGLLRLCAEAAGLMAGPALDDLGVAWAAAGTARATLPADARALLLVQTAESRLLGATRDLPEIFAPFKDAVQFYLRRLKAGKATGREVGFSLMLSLCWRRFLRGVELR
jgi:phytoene synthase